MLCLSKKKQFYYEPVIFQLRNVQNILKHYWGLQLSTKMNNNLFQCFIFFCSHESNMKVELTQTVLLDCGTHPPLYVSCYFIYSITNVELLIHIDFLPDLASYMGTSPRFSASWITVFRLAEIASSSFSLR